MDGIPEDPPTVRDDLPPYARGLGTSFECPGEEIGPYTLVSPLGEGGFGSVWLARRRAPFEQKVALKVIKPGMDSRSVLSRFEQERQALALMEHPSIAKVYDGGLTPRGRPYFAMEYVKGEPITAFCDRLRLGIEDRLRLFSEACEAVQHAHLKGIVHRDLKPSNILAFQTEGGEARLKVIDFGVAKAMGPSLTGETVFTEPGLMLGTPEYMSPEQADPGMGGIDTRSDIFSLGVLLYELLVGATPWDGRELRKRAQREIQRILREEDPPTPSARLSTLVTHDRDSAGRIESTRKSRAEDLVRRLRGELEWIPLKAMRKEPHHRYQTALSLAEDVRSYLEGKPLLAGPESTAYRARKYLRRHAALATGAAAVATALLAGMAGVWWQWSRAERALVAERERAEELTAVSDFQSEMLRQIDVFEAGTALMADLRDRHAGSLARSGIPEAETAGSADSFRAELARVNGTDAAVSVIDAIVLRPATKAIEDRFGDKPVVAARLRQALADVYANLGLFEEAEPLQVSSLETRRKWLGEFDPETLESLDRLGVLRAQQARYEESEELLVGALEARRRILGEDRKETIDSIANLGWLRHLQMRLDETESLYREALAASRRVLGKDHPETLVSMGNLAALLRTRSSWAESESLYREAIDTRRRISGDDDPDTISLLGNYGSLLLARGRLEEAEAICREVLEQSGRVWGEDHPRTLTALNNLGRVLSGRQQAEAAESCYRDVLARRRRLLGDGHPDTLTSIHNLGAFLRARGRFDEAEALLGEAFAGRGRTLGPNHLHTLDTMSSIGVLRMARDRLDEAEPLLAAVLERRRASLGSKDLLTLLSIGNMGTLRRLQGRLPEAESLYLEMLETSRSELGPYHAQTLSAIVSLGDVRLAAGRPDDAGPLLDGALEAECRRVFGDRDPQTMVWVLNRGRFLLDRGRHEEAVALLVPAEPTMRLVFTDGNRPKLAVFLVTLARGTIGLGHDADRFRSAESDLLEAHAMLVETRGASHADTRDCVQGLIDLYASWDAAEPGAGFADRASEWRSRLDPVAD